MPGQSGPPLGKAEHPWSTLPRLVISSLLRSFKECVNTKFCLVAAVLKPIQFCIKSTKIRLTFGHILCKNLEFFIATEGEKHFSSLCNCRKCAPQFLLFRCARHPARHGQPPSVTAPRRRGAVNPDISTAPLQPTSPDCTHAGGRRTKRTTRRANYPNCQRQAGGPATREREQPCYSYSHDANISKTAKKSYSKAEHRAPDARSI